MTSYLITTDSGDSLELAHHGVKGMKWGVRKERPKSDKQIARQNWKDTKKIAKRLNQLDQRRAVLLDRSPQAGLTSAKARYNRAQGKYNKAKLSGNVTSRTTSKLEKAKANYDKHVNIQNEWNNKLSNVRKEALDLGKQAATKGYHIRVTDTRRVTQAYMINGYIYYQTRPGQQFKAQKKRDVNPNNKRAVGYLEGDTIVYR